MMSLKDLKEHHFTKWHGTGTLFLQPFFGQGLDQLFLLGVELLG